MRRVRECIAIAVLLAGVACETTGAGSTRDENVVSAAGDGSGSNGKLATLVCRRSLSLLEEKSAGFVGGGTEIPSSCKRVEVRELGDQTVARIYYPGDPVPWRVRVVREAEESGTGRLLPGFAEALSAKPEQVKKQRARDTIIVLKEFMAEYLKSPEVESMPASLSALTDLDGVDEIPRDPWDRSYMYNSSGSSMVLISPGPDGRTDTKDDVRAGHDCIGGERSCLNVIQVY